MYRFLFLIFSLIDVKIHGLLFIFHFQTLCCFIFFVLQILIYLCTHLFSYLELNLKSLLHFLLSITAIYDMIFLLWYLQSYSQVIQCFLLNCSPHFNCRCCYSFESSQLHCYLSFYLLSFLLRLSVLLLSFNDELMLKRDKRAGWLRFFNC